MSIDKRWIQSFSGRKIDVLDPQPSSFTLQDVAHSLALKNRFSGMTSVPFSVAQHCVVGSAFIAPEFALAFLMHELGEVAAPDVPAPLKPFLRVTVDCNCRPGGCGPVLIEWPDLEERFEDAILKALDLEQLKPKIHSPEVKHMDLAMLAWEARDLMGPPPESWGLPHAPPSPAELGAWSWVRAEDEFLKRFRELAGDL